tara:strand:- start:31493 stop:32044 length:552 start_codon:yes stop_codon:yes gene_type:complete
MGIPQYGMNKHGDHIEECKDLQRQLGLTVVKASSGAITATAAATTQGTFAQPANSWLKDLIIVPQSTLTTGNNGSDELDFCLGTAAGGAQLMTQKAILDGADLSLAANIPLYVLSNGQSVAANASLGSGAATSEASVVAGSLYSAAGRTVHFEFTPINQDLAATGAATVIAVFVQCDSSIHNS